MPMPSLKLTRIIHPVGQGAFYSETFSSDLSGPLLSVVYDCGSSSKSKIKSMIENLESLGILFISHFHDDHTNMIDTLLNRNNNALVIIPGINHCRFLVDLISNYLHTGSTCSSSILFMLRCVTALKTPKDSGEIILQGDLSSMVPTTKKIIALAPSSTLIIKSISYEWCYDACYSEYDTSKESELIEKLATIIPSLKDILNNPNAYRDPVWYQEHLLVELSKLQEAGLSQIKNVYSKVFGKEKHNSYSMLVHSHALNRDVANSDCLYTGDIEITDQVKTIIQKLDPHYIQVPHHGSAKNHNRAAYHRRQIAFISVGTSNKYGHPGRKVLMDLLQICPYIHVVTEFDSTRFSRSFKI